MKLNTKLLTLFISSVLILSSCDKDFEQMNKSEDLVTSPTLDYMIPKIQLNLFERSYYTHYTMLAILSQQMHGSNVDSYKSQSTTMSHLFDDIYANAMKNVVDVIEKTKNEPELVNYWAVASILRAYEISRMTDAYGDVPYLDAGLGYEQQVFYPKYTPQKDVYYGICDEIEKAIKSFDVSLKMVPKESDILYQGDIDQWKRLGYSLMLRYGMRMSNVDPVKAKEVVLKAYNGGVMNSNEDTFVIYYLPDTYYSTTANGNAAANKYDYKNTDVFVNLLKETNDPRLPVYVMLPNGDTDPKKQNGFQLFTSDKTNKKVVSTPNINTYARFDAPYVHMSYAETRFLLAEAMLKGWLSGNPEDYFRAGIKANMEQQQIYGSQGEIAEKDIQSYLSSVTFNAANEQAAFEAIHMQMWVMFYFNWNESFANWRRTGVPNFNAEINSKINRRLIYPQSEWNTNGENVRDAVERQGGDDVMTRVWWDSK